MPVISNLQGLWAEEPHSSGTPRRYGKVWSVQNAICRPWMSRWKSTPSSSTKLFKVRGSRCW